MARYIITNKRNPFVAQLDCSSSPMKLIAALCKGLFISQSATKGALSKSSLGLLNHPSRQVQQRIILTHQSTAHHPLVCSLTTHLHCSNTSGESRSHRVWSVAVYFMHALLDGCSLLRGKHVPFSTVPVNDQQIPRHPNMTCPPPHCVHGVWLQGYNVHPVPGSFGLKLRRCGTVRQALEMLL